MSLCAARGKPEFRIFLIEALREEFLRFMVLRDVTMHLKEVECKSSPLRNDLFIVHRTSALKLFQLRFRIYWGAWSYLLCFFTGFLICADLFSGVHNLRDRDRWVKSQCLHNTMSLKGQLKI